MTHFVMSELKYTIIVSDNVLSPRRRQAIIWTNAGILLIGPLGTNFRDIFFYQISYIFISENAIENFVCETVVILSRSQCVYSLQPDD